jgi:ribosomal protein L18
MQITKKERRQRRAIKTRMKIRELGVARLTVHRTPQHIYAQVFDSSGAKVLESQTASGESIEIADVIGDRVVTPCDAVHQHQRQHRRGNRDVDRRPR